MTTKKIKKFLLLCFAVISLGLSGHSIPLEEGVGLGRYCQTGGSDCISFESYPPRIFFGRVNNVTFQNGTNNYSSQTYKGVLFLKQKYRVANYVLKLSPSTAGNISFRFFSLNFSNGFETWTPVSTKVVYTDSANYTTPVEHSFSTDTNVGIVAVALIWTTNPSGFIHLSGESTVDYPSPQVALSDPMTAGGRYVVPLVNMWRPQNTEVFDVSFNVLSEASNNSGLYYTTLQLSCSAPTNELTYNIVVNYNKSNTAQQNAYGFYTNVTELQDLNFTAISPTNNTNISISIGGVGNFSVLPNLPERVEAIVLYVNHSYEKINPATNGSFNYVFNYPGEYIVEVQAEDNDCKKYPTAVWYVNVGRTIEIFGQVYGNVDGVISSLNGVYVILNSSNNIFKTNITDQYGSFFFGNLPAGNYTLSLSKSGFSSLTTTVSCPYSSNPNVAVTQYSYAFTLNRSRNNCSAVFKVYDKDTYSPVLNYTLDLYLDEKVFSTANGSTLLSRYSITAKTSNNIINVSNLAPDYTYRFAITKSGYNVGWGVFSCSVDADENISYPLSKVDRTCNANFSYTYPQGGNYDLSLVNSVEIGTLISTSDHNFKVCSSYSLLNNTYENVVCRDEISGVYSLTDELPGLIANRTYYFKYYAVSKYCSSILFETSGYFTTYGGLPPSTTVLTTTTTKITIRTTTTTTTRYAYASTTTLPPIIYGNATKIEYNCSNITHLIKNGDIFHAVVCPYVLFFGVSIFYGITLFVITILVYQTTKSYAVAGIMSLIYTSVFINVLPQPTVNYLSVGVGISFGLLLYDLFKGR